jgi:hypothetical protein
VVLDSGNGIISRNASTMTVPLPSDRCGSTEMSLSHRQDLSYQTAPCLYRCTILDDLSSRAAARSAELTSEDYGVAETEELSAHPTPECLASRVSALAYCRWMAVLALDSLPVLPHPATCRCSFGVPRVLLTPLSPELHSSSCSFEGVFAILTALPACPRRR